MSELISFLESGNSDVRCVLFIAGFLLLMNLFLLFRRS